MLKIPLKIPDEDDCHPLCSRHCRRLLARCAIRGPYRAGHRAVAGVKSML